MIEQIGSSSGRVTGNKTSSGSLKAAAGGAPTETELVLPFPACPGLLDLMLRLKLARPCLTSRFMVNTSNDSVSEGAVDSHSSTTFGASDEHLAMTKCLAST